MAAREALQTLGPPKSSTTKKKSNIFKKKS